MAVVAKNKGGSDYVPPPPGVHVAKCIDVVDLGEEETPFKDERTGKPKIAHKIQVVWQLFVEDESGDEVLRDDGTPFRISKFYTLSLNEKANLRRDLEGWRGKPFTDTELSGGFDVEKLLGHQCQLNCVAAKSKAGKSYVGVMAVLPKNKRDPLIETQDGFVREMDRPGGRDVRSPAAVDAEAVAAGATMDPDDFIEDDEDLPF